MVGVDIGLPHKAIERLRNGETQADIARSYAVDATTIGRLRPFSALADVVVAA